MTNIKYSLQYQQALTSTINIQPKKRIRNSQQSYSDIPAFMKWSRHIIFHYLNQRIGVPETFQFGSRNILKQINKWKIKKPER